MYSTTHVNARCVYDMCMNVVRENTLPSVDQPAMIIHTGTVRFSGWYAQEANPKQKQHNYRAHTEEVYHRRHLGNRTTINSK